MLEWTRFLLLKPPYLGGHKFQVTEQNWMIQKLTTTLANELQITLRPHHPPNVNHDTILIFVYIKCLFIGITFTLKDKSNVLIK
jgi:hypothetical protein